MIAESDELLGYSNVLTVTRGRTIRGQVPNAECAQWTNDDRSEPYVGAQVVLQHYRKYVHGVVCVWGGGGGGGRAAALNNTHARMSCSLGGVCVLRPPGGNHSFRTSPRQPPRTHRCAQAPGTAPPRRQQRHAGGGASTTNADL